MDRLADGSNRGLIRFPFLFKRLLFGRHLSGGFALHSQDKMLAVFMRIF